MMYTSQKLTKTVCIKYDTLDIKELIHYLGYLQTIK